MERDIKLISCTHPIFAMEAHLPYRFPAVIDRNSALLFPTRN